MIGGLGRAAPGATTGDATAGDDPATGGAAAAGGDAATGGDAAAGSRDSADAGVSRPASPSRVRSRASSRRTRLQSVRVAPRSPNSRTGNASTASPRPRNGRTGQAPISSPVRDDRPGSAARIHDRQHGVLRRDERGRHVSSWHAPPAGHAAGRGRLPERDRPDRLECRPTPRSPAPSLRPGIPVLSLEHPRLLAVRAHPRGDGRSPAPGSPVCLC